MRGLMVAVVGMGVLIVAGVVVVATTLFTRMSGPGTAVASTLLDEPAGTRIAGVSLSPDRLAVQLAGAGPDRVVLVDTKTGRVVGRAALSR